MLTDSNRFFSSIASPKIAFLLIIASLISFALVFNSCSTKKKKKKVKKIEYSLNQYPLTEYYLTVDKDSLDYIYEHYEENIYIGLSLKIGEETFEGVKMRIRGDSSRELDKKSLKLKLAKGSKLSDGAKKINLNADHGDKTMMHQYLASKTMNDNGQLCFRSGYVPLYINGEYFGLYLRVENMDSKFLKSRNLSNKDNMYKASKDYSCLVNRNEVDSRWEKKANEKDEDNDDLKDLIDELNEVSVVDFEQFLQENFFYDELINIIALNMLISNSSTYYHNYYMYHDLAKDKWRMLPWDMDKTFNPDHIDYNYQRTAWAEGKNAGMNTNTLIEKSLANRETLKTIRKRIAELQPNFTKEIYNVEVDKLINQIGSYVLNDTTNKISSEKKWRKNLDELLRYVENRPASLLTQIDNKPINFMVSKEVIIDGNEVLISWERAIDPNDLPISYTLHYAKNGSFNDDSVRRVENLNSTEAKIENLSSGKYYFFVEANNTHYKTYGHDIRNYFVIP